MPSVRESESGASRGFGGDGRRERRALLQALNDRVGDSARRHHFDSARIPFQCECGDDECREFALFTLTEYEERRKGRSPLLAPAHA
jgi:hypothetical protein